jgi:hypothetical protein
MPVQTRIQIRRGTTAEWVSSANSLGNGILYQGELGYDTEAKIFKIGDGTTHWTNLASAGGSVPGAGSGMIIVPSGTNQYAFHSIIVPSGSGVSATLVSASSGSYYSINLNEKLRDIAALSSQGFIVNNGASDVYERTLASGSNILLTNANGVAGNPTISLNSSLTGISNISATGGLTISGGAGQVTVDDDLTVTGLLTVNDISINIAAEILAQGPITYSGNPTRFQGDVYFDNIPKVGPTGNGGIYATGVSLSGHKHIYSDITDFCSGVATCVDTSLLAGTGIQFISGANSLTIALSGQALNLHNYTGTGIIVRDNAGNFYNRTITTSNNNIVLTDADGVAGNPSVSLNNTITGLTSVTSDILSTTNITTNKVFSSGSTVTIDAPNVSVTGNLSVGGNVLINGTGVLVQSTVVVVDDPIFTLGGSGIALNDSKDRGIEFKYNDGSSRVGFFGYQDSSDKFIFLRQATNTNEVFSGTKGEIDAYLNWSNLTGNIPDPTVTVTLNGAVSGSANGTITNLSGNPTITINASMGNDQVTLGTHTVGNYVASITNGNYLTGGNGGSEGAALTLAVDATSSNTASKVVARDSNGNFSAGTITATGFIGSGSGLTDLNASNLTTGIVSSARLSGTYNISVTGVVPGTSGMLLQSDGVVSYWGWINGGTP